MRIRSTVTALGTTLALALLLIATSAPVFAELLQVEKVDPPISILEAGPQQVQPKSPPRKPRGEGNGEGTGIVFKPDVRVIYQGDTWNGANIEYRFRVENIAVETAYNVVLANKISHHHINSTLGTLQSGSSGTIASLATDQFQDVTITCAPLPNYYCDGASLSAIVPNDLNQANNRAGSN